MTAYPTQAANLSAYNGPSDGYVLNCAAQEVDISTGTIPLRFSEVFVI